MAVFNSTNKVAAAGLLTGTALASNVVSSSLTSLGTLSSLSVSGTSSLDGQVTIPNGNLVLSATSGSRRIISDYTNSTRATRTLFQTAILVNNTDVGAIPTSGGTSGSFTGYSSSDPNNSAYGQFGANSTGTIVNSAKVGSGTTTGLYFQIDSTTVGSFSTGGAFNIVSLTASQAVVTDGSKNLVSLAYATAATATTLAERDANANLTNNNHIDNYVTTATAAGTTTLTVGSARQQYFTGSTTQTVVLPVTSTLVLGQNYIVVNNSSGNVTVNSSGSNAVQVMSGGTYAIFTCILTSGTSAASWGVQYVSSSSSITIGSLDGTTPSANGAVISSDVLYMQSASSDDSGLVNTSAQNFAGQKTFDSTAYFTGGINSFGNLLMSSFLGPVVLEGDLSNSTRSSRFSITTAAIDGAADLGIFPDGVGASASVTGYNTSDRNNSGYGQFGCDATSVFINAAKSGTGTTLPIQFRINGSSVGSISTGGVFNIAGLTASQTVVTDGSKNLTSLSYVTTATASTLAQRDSNANLTSNSSIDGYTTTATAAGTTTLTVGSTKQQYFTGSTTQTVVLPVTSTLVLGQTYVIANNSTGVVTVNSSGSNLVKSMDAGTSATFTCILTSGTSAASWSVKYSLSSTLGVGTLDGTTPSSNGAVIGAGNLYMQSASATLPGVVNTTSQTFAGTKTFNSGIISFGDLLMSPAGGFLRIIGELSNATRTNRLLFTNAVSNGNSDVGVFPDGSGTSGSWTGYAASDPTNSAYAQFGANSSGAFINSAKVGSGTTGPLIFQINGSLVASFSTGGLFNVAGLTASQAVVTDGSKNFVSLGYATAATATTLAERDANANLTVNATIAGYTTTATGAGTTTLTVGSTEYQYFTGTSTQTVVLPVTSTLVLNQPFTVVNNSTGLVTVQSSGANTIRVLEPSSQATFSVISTSGTGVASWNYKHVSAAGSALNTNNQTGTTYSFALTDIGGTTTASNASASTYTLPQTSNIAFPIGSRIKLINIGAGVVTLVKEGSETLLGNVTLNQYAVAEIEKTSATQWDVFGATASVNDGFSVPIIKAATASDVAYFTLYAGYAGTIVSCSQISDSLGTAGTYTVSIDGVSVTGLTTVTNGTTKTTTSASGANVFAVGSVIKLALSAGVVAGVNMGWSLLTTRTY